MGQQKEAKSNLISFKRKVFFEGVPNKEIVEASESNSIISDNERKLLKVIFFVLRFIAFWLCYIV